VRLSCCETCDHAPTSLRDALETLTSTAHLVCRGARALARAEAEPSAESHGAVATAVEGTEDFRAFAALAVKTLPKYRDQQVDKLLEILEEQNRRARVSLDDLSLLDLEWQVRQFLRRSRYYIDLWRGQDPQPEERAQRLQEVLLSDESQMTEIVPLDGLDPSAGPLRRCTSPSRGKTAFVRVARQIAPVSPHRHSLLFVSRPCFAR
jgi:hypothetical protein